MTTPRELSDRYVLGETIGFGGMSEVYLARDQRLDRDVAIKVLRADLARDPTFYLRFKREAQNAAALNHPSIVAVYDTGEAETDEGPLPYIVMEYVDGDTLRDLVRNDGPMDPRRACAVVADVCAALDFSHQVGIVHRDIKPANVMINRAGEVKVMDFGIARALSDATSTMTQTAAVIGTAQYLSPEQARGERVDARSDIYSLGCVLYEILTGEPPFTGDSPVAVAYQHVSEEPQPPSAVNPDISRELDAVVLHAMSKNPANRYQTAAEMRGDLVSVLSGQQPDAPMVMTDQERTDIFGAVPPVPPRRAAAVAAVAPDPESDPPAGTNRMRWLIVALVGLVVLAATFFFINLGTGDSTQVTVPDVAGLSVDDAENRLYDAGLKVARQSRPDPEVEDGMVLGTTPAGGTTISKGQTVTLLVSTGPEMVEVPDLLGRSEDEARSILEELGLTVADEVKRESSEEGDKDKIVAQNPNARARIEAGSPVSLVVGGGPEKRSVPDVTGQTLDKATRNLEGAGFRVRVVQTDSREPADTVLRTDPPGGEDADTDSEVTVYVSNAVLVPMPDLLGMNRTRALDALRTAGWTGSESQLHIESTNTLDPSAVGRVTSQQPATGDDLNRSGTVTVQIAELGIP